MSDSSGHNHRGDGDYHHHSEHRHSHYHHSHDHGYDNADSSRNHGRQSDWQRHQRPGNGRPYDDRQRGGGSRFDRRDRRDDGQNLKRKASDVPPEQFEEPTFAVSGDAGLNHKHLEELLTAAGMRKVDKLEPGMVLRFLWMELMETFRFDRTCFSVLSYARNILDDEKKRTCVSDKGNLHRMLQKQFPEVAAAHLPATFCLDDLQPDKVDWDHHMYIVRPTGTFAWCGNGIQRATNADELRKIQRDMAKSKDRPLASEYIKNPLLWQGRKMHLRTYWLVRGRTDHSPFFTMLWDRAKILTAKKPYVCGHFEDSEIHDSHAKGTPRNLFWPDDLRDALTTEQIEHIQNQMREVLSCIGKAFEPIAQPFPESLWGFEIFGCDFMVDAESLNVFLLECNERVGYQMVPGETDASGRFAKFTEDYYNWVYDNALAPLLQLPPRSSLKLPPPLPSSKDEENKAQEKIPSPVEEEPSTKAASQKLPETEVEPQK